MKKLLYYLLLLNSIVYAQIIDQEIPLSRIVDETSGLAQFEGLFWTHNDSGNEAVLYGLSANGEIVKKIPVAGAKNRDWEDIAFDGSHCYLADTGNNFGIRKKLNIHILPYPYRTGDSLGTIELSYQAQKNFIPKIKTPFDAEALVCIGESLLLFSKNNKTLTTELYVFPKKPGSYRLEKIGSLAVGALITGADYEPKSRLLAMSAYSPDKEPFLITIPNFDLRPNRQYEIRKYPLALKKAQIEGIYIENPKSIWLSSERVKKIPARLLHIQLD